MDMLKELLILIGIVMLPFIELRLAIPVGILSGTMYLPYGIHMSGLGLEPLLVFFTAVLSNIFLGFIVFNFLTIFDKRLRNTRISKYYVRLLERSRKKVHRQVEKYGILGLAVFIGLPIPGSGIYSGSLAAFVLGFSKRNFYIANFIGVTLAGIIVTILTLIGNSLF